jgi:hypothetical protein
MAPERLALRRNTAGVRPYTLDLLQTGTIRSMRCVVVVMLFLIALLSQAGCVGECSAGHPPSNVRLTVEDATTGGLVISPMVVLVDEKDIGACPCGGCATVGFTLVHQHLVTIRSNGYAEKTLMLDGGATTHSCGDWPSKDITQTVQLAPQPGADYSISTGGCAADGSVVD